jgi:hypothetical protein
MVDKRISELEPAGPLTGNELVEIAQQVGSELESVQAPLQAIVQQLALQGPQGPQGDDGPQGAQGQSGLRFEGIVPANPRSLKGGLGGGLRQGHRATGPMSGTGVTNGHPSTHALQ